MARASGTRKKYIGIRSLIVKDDTAFELKDNKEEQKFASDDGNLVVTVQEDSSKYIGPQKVKYLDMRFHSLDGTYTIIEISRKSRQYDRWQILHPLEYGFDSIRFDSGNDLELDQWPAIVLVPVTLFQEGQVELGRIFDVLQVRLLLRHQSGRMRTVTLKIPFSP